MFSMVRTSINILAITDDATRVMIHIHYELSLCELIFFQFVQNDFLKFLAFAATSTFTQLPFMGERVYNPHKGAKTILYFPL